MLVHHEDDRQMLVRKMQAFLCNRNISNKLIKILRWARETSCSPKCVEDNRCLKCLATEVINYLKDLQLERLMDFLNIIICNDNVKDRDRTDLFPDEEIVHILWPGHGKDMYDLLVLIEAFNSKSQARKNWKLTGKDIPEGWSEFFIGKQKRHLCIWNPTNFIDED